MDPVHPLRAVMAETTPFLLIGDSDSDRFPRASYACYTKIGKDFRFLDMGRRDLSAYTQGRAVSHSPEEVQGFGGDLAVVWVHPFSVVKAVEWAHRAGCRRIWFSFGTISVAGLSRAGELGLEVLEAGRCPVYFLTERTGPCRVHGWVVDLLGVPELPPQTHAGEGRRELV